MVEEIKLNGNVYKMLACLVVFLLCGGVVLTYTNRGRACTDKNIIENSCDVLNEKYVGDNKESNVVSSKTKNLDDTSEKLFIGEGKKELPTWLKNMWNNFYYGPIERNFDEIFDNQIYVITKGRLNNKSILELDFYSYDGEKLCKTIDLGTFFQIKNKSKMDLFQYSTDNYFVVSATDHEMDKFYYIILDKKFNIVEKRVLKIKDKYYLSNWAVVPEKEMIVESKMIDGGSVIIYHNFDGTIKKRVYNEKLADRRIIEEMYPSKDGENVEFRGHYNKEYNTEIVEEQIKGKINLLTDRITIEP